MPTTTLIRSWWDPACEGPFVKIALYGHGAVSVDPAIADAVHALSACLERYSYETRAADTGAYNCRQITGGTDFSLHAYAIALDLNWLSNPYGPVLVTDMPAAMVAAIKAIRTVNGKQVWRWGGDYSGNKDAMHFEVVAHPADLATGIDPASLPQPKSIPPATIEDADVFTAISPNDFTWLFEQDRYTLVPAADEDNVAKVPVRLGKVSEPFWDRLIAGRARHQETT